MKTYREPFVRHLVDMGRLNLRNGPYRYVWPTPDAERPDGVVEIARKYIPDPPPPDDLAEWCTYTCTLPVRVLLGRAP